MARIPQPLCDASTMNGYRYCCLLLSAMLTAFAADGREVTPAKPLHSPAPMYPAEEQQLGHEGAVWVLLTVRKDGTVKSPLIGLSTGWPVLDQAALAAVESWKFSPALDETGQPIESPRSFLLTFALPVPADENIFRQQLLDWGAKVESLQTVRSMLNHCSQAGIQPDVTIKLEERVHFFVEYEIQLLAAKVRGQLTAQKVDNPIADLKARRKTLEDMAQSKANLIFESWKPDQGPRCQSYMDGLNQILTKGKG